MRRKFSRRECPSEDAPRAFRISKIDFDILEAVLCYRFSCRRLSTQRESRGSEERALKLMEIAGHPLVSGPNKRAGTFRFTISELFTVLVEHEGQAAQVPHPARRGL